MDALTAPIKPVDPDTFIPPSVRALAARATELQTAHIAEVTGTPPIDPNAPPVDPNAPPATPAPPAAPTEPPLTATPPVTSPGEPPVAPLVVQAPTASDDGPDDEAPPAADTKATYWHRRYRSMKGRYDHELPRYKHSLDQANQRIMELTAQARSTPAPVPPAPTVSDGPVSNDTLLASGFTQDEIDMWGPEMAQSIYRVSAKMASAATAHINGRVAQIQNSTLEQEAAVMFDTLAKQVPTWREVNTDPRFLTWLALPDPMSGVIRQELLSKAFEENKSSRVVAFFKGFLSEEPPAAPAVPSSVPPTPVPTAVIPAPAPRSQRIPLEALAAPGGARSSAQPAPTEKPHYTPAGIGQFLDQKARGLWRGREAEADAIEADIFLAQSEGRVIG